MGENIRVAVRVRPFNQREMERGAKLIVDMQGTNTLLSNPQDLNAEPKKFSFDHSYWSHDGYKEDGEGYMHATDDRYCDQSRVFNDLGEGVLKNAWLGYNCSLFAYGQTGSGKSYSIVGYGANRGVIPVVCQNLFSKISEKQKDNPADEYEVWLSMIEIYNEQVRDLLNAATMKIKGGLKIREHPKKGFYVEKLTQVKVSSYENIELKMELGTKNRTIASTAMNATSSRAHTIVAMSFIQKAKNAQGQEMTKTSVINLVDLAGSERAASTAATGDRLKEGAAINQSLSTLGNVISALADKAMDSVKGKKIIVPFRDSALTRLLKTALGGNSKTIMMAAISPADINYDESLSTLKFADRVKRIKTKASVNESPTEKLIRELREENAKLMKMLGVPGAGLPDQEEQPEQQGAGEISAEEKEKMRKELEEELRAQMQQNESELEEAKKSFQEKLEASKREFEKEKEELQKREREEQKRKKKPYFWNLNEDPALSGIVSHFVERTKILIGKGEKCHIKLTGLSILEEHALVEVDGGGIFITVMSGAKITINGDPLTTKLELHHNDRVVFSSGHVYVLHHPHQFKKAEKDGKKFEVVTWDQVHQEIAEKSGYDVNRKGKTEAELLLQEDLISLMPMVNEVNAISEELDKKKHFDIALVSPQARGLSDGRTFVMVKMLDLVQGNYWMWDRNKFINRKYKMEEMYQNMIDGHDWNVSAEIDPFYEDIHSHVLIGQSQIHLKCLAYQIGFEESIIITDYEARERGFLQIEIQPLKCDGTPIGDDDEEYFVEDPEELIGKTLTYQFKILGAKGLPAKISEHVYCEFRLYLDDTTKKTEEVSSKNPDWNWSTIFSHTPVTKQLLTYLNDEPLIVEVWGKQRVEGKKSAEQLTTKQLKSLNEKEKITTVMKKVAANPTSANLDIAVALRKVETMLKMINDLKAVVTEAKQNSLTTVDISSLEEILTPENTRLEEVDKIIQLEKENQESQVCSVQ